MKKKIIFAMVIIIMSGVVFSQQGPGKVGGVPPTDGKCGSANGMSLETFPGLERPCSSGKAINIKASTTGWTWACEGSGGGQNSPTCSATRISTDTAKPTIEITSPTKSDKYSTLSASIAVSGTSSDNKGVASVTYALSGATTGTGTAKGTTSWSFTASLRQGTTTITVTARDAAGNTATDTLAVTVFPAPKIDSFDADKDEITTGVSAGLTWKSNAESCTLSPPSKTILASSTSPESLSPTATTTYTLACNRLGQSDTKTLTINVHPNPTAKITKSGDLILAQGQSGTASLSWQATDASTCEIKSDSFTTGLKNVKDLQSPMTVTLSKTTTYTIACNGFGAGSASSTTTVNVDEPGKPVIKKFQADKTDAKLNDLVSISWSAENVDTCTGLKDFSGKFSWSKGQAMNAISAKAEKQKNEYQISCTGQGGTKISDILTVNAHSPPVMNYFRKTGDMIPDIKSVFLEWSSDDPSGLSEQIKCTSNAWTGEKGKSGSYGVSPTATRTYTLSCTGFGGTSSAEPVTVEAAAKPVPSVSIRAEPTSSTPKQPVTIAWRTENAPAGSSCSVTSDTAGFSKSGLQGTETVNPERTTKYTVTCSFGKSSSATVSVSTVASIITIFSKNKDPVLGSSVTLTWNANADSCTASGAWSGQKLTSGSETLTPPSSGQINYYLSCSSRKDDVERISVAAVTVAVENKCANVACKPTSCPEGFFGGAKNTCNPETGLCSQNAPACVRVTITPAAPADTTAKRKLEGASNFVRSGDSLSLESIASDPDSDPIKLICGTAVKGKDVCDSNYFLSNPQCSSPYTALWNDNAGHDIHCFVQDRPKDGSTAKDSEPITIQTNADNTAPSVSVTGAPSQWQKDDAQASAACSDSGSGCDTASVKLKFYTSPPGGCPNDYDAYPILQIIPDNVAEHKWYCAAAKDNVGNAGFSEPAEFKVDKLQPASSVSCNGASCKAEPEFYNEDVGIVIQCADTGGSSCAPIKYKITQVDSDFKTNVIKDETKEGPITAQMTAHGHYTIEYQVSDIAGNAEQLQTKRIFVNKRALTEELVVTLDFFKLTGGREISTRMIKILRPDATSPDFLGTMGCYVRNRETKQTLKQCDEKTSVKKYDITTSDKTVHDYLAENAGKWRWNPDRKRWEFPIDTRIYQSNVKGCANDDGVEGCADDNYFPVNSVLSVEVEYPDVQNFLIPSTPTGAPNFTRSMPINFNAIPRILEDDGTQRVCTADNCDVFYSIDIKGADEMAAGWNDFGDYFNASPESKSLSCDQYHTLYVRARKKTLPDLDLQSETESKFFVNCIPRVTVSPAERRLVIGERKTTAFNVTVWNPLSAAEFQLAMSSSEAGKEFVLEWLSLNCTGAEGCTANDDTATLTLGDVSSKTVFAELEVAGKSGVFPIKFTASSGGKKYEGTGTLQIFAEGLPEFALWQLAVAIMLLTIFIWRKPELIIGKRNKK